MHRVSVQWSGDDLRERKVVEYSKESDSDVEDSESGPLPISELPMSLPARITVCGGSGSGKTTVIRHLVRLMKSKGKVSAVFWLGASADEETWLPRKYRRTTVSKPLLERIRQMQKHGEMRDWHVIVVLDDVMDQKFTHDRWWAHFLSSCRHQRVSVIAGIQYISSGLSPAMRENMSRWIVTHGNNKTLRALFDLSSSRTDYVAWRASASDSLQCIG